MTAAAFNPSESLRSATTERDQYLRRTEAIREVATSATRDLTADEDTAINSALDQVERLDRDIATLQRQERAAAAQAVPAVDPALPAAPAAPAGPSVLTREVAKPPGILFAQMALARALFKDDSYAAQSWAREKHDPLLEWSLNRQHEQLARATVAVGDTTTSGFAEQIAGFDRNAAEFIELLRNESVLMQLGARQLQFGTRRNIEIPRQTGGVSGGYVGEDAPIAVEAIALDKINLTPKKAATIVVISRELAQYSDPAALVIVRDDMVAGVAGAMDTRACTASAGSATAPAGLLNGGGTAAGLATGTAVENITADLLAAQSGLDTANIPSGGWVLILNTQERNRAMAALDSLGNYPFRDEVIRGTLWGHRLLVSNAMAAGTVSLIAARQVLHAESPSPLIDTSTDAAVHMSDAPDADIGGAGLATPVASLWQRDLIGTRVIFEHDLLKRRAAAEFHITACDWIN